MIWVYLGSILTAGIVVGFFIGLAFSRAVLMDADKRYEEANDLFIAGTEEYRKAIRCLEISREERDANMSNLQQSFNTIVAIIKKYLPEEVLAELGDIFNPINLER